MCARKVNRDEPRAAFLSSDLMMGLATIGKMVDGPSQSFQGVSCSVIPPSGTEVGNEQRMFRGTVIVDADSVSHLSFPPPAICLIRI